MEGGNEMKRVVVETNGWIRGDVEAEAVDVHFAYDPADPYAVTVQIRREHEDLLWVFSRDLLADGLRSMAPVGEGDLQVQATSVLTEISKSDENGDAMVLRVPWWNSREFVRLAQIAVPRGQERVDVDSWISELTAIQEP